MSIVPQKKYLVEHLDKIADIASHGLYCCASEDNILGPLWIHEAEESKKLAEILRIAGHKFVDYVGECLDFFGREFDELPDKLDQTKAYADVKSAISLLQRQKDFVLGYKLPFLFKWSATIRELSSKFKDYRHGNITQESIQDWLLQFSSDNEMYLALNLLCGVEYIRTEEIGKAFQEYYNAIPKKLKGNIRVVLLGTQADSMAEMEKIFKDYCKLDDSVLSKSLKDSVRTIKKNQEYLFLFIDDFIGTGTQSTDVLKEYLKLSDELDYEDLKYVKQSEQLSAKQVLTLKKQKVVYVACAAMEEGYNRLTEFLSNKNFKFEVKLLPRDKPLKRCFDVDYTKKDGEPLFEQDSVRIETMELFRSYGMNLWNNHPLGYKDSQQLVAFTHTIPNNSITALWLRNEMWEPLLWRPQGK